MVSLVQGNALAIPLADKSVHCIVTSPVYWGLRAYATGEHKAHELGSEPLHDCLGWATGADCGECYICRMRQVARECWRVLRDDGVMFWNIADSYANPSSPGGNKATPPEWQRPGRGESNRIGPRVPPGLKPKDKCGIPERTALAFQADGWWYRSGITWVKPNPMPESVTDRPTKSTEMIYVFTKSERYFWDAEAVRAEHTEATIRRTSGLTYEDKEVHYQNIPDNKVEGRMRFRGHQPERVMNPAGRNLRDAWTIATHSYPGAHYATFPPELPRRCIKAGTSERGCCPKCGRGWVRVMEREPMIIDRSFNHPAELRTRTSGTMVEPPKSTTLGFRPACACDAGDPVPCVVLDPFSGAATTGLVARELGRHYVGLELSGEYLKQSRERLGLAALDAWAGGNGRKHEPASITDLPLFGGQHE